VDTKFWQNRWQDNSIPWHRADINHYLEKYFDRLALGDGDEVLVPLCGKSVDMRWLVRRGCRVTGVELSDIAVRDFFQEQGIIAVERQDDAFQVLEGEGIRLLCGDFFALQTSHAADVAAVYDRAALIALPREMRARYVDHLLSLLAPGVPILLLTFEYPSHEIDGPPFSVDEAEVRALYSSRRRVVRLESVDRLADEARLAERGLTQLEEHAFLLTEL
jgi:thiopurine S-methyltransferase